MNVEEQNQVRRWVAVWEGAGRALEDERRVRLRSMTPTQRREAIRAVLELAVAHPAGSVPASSGLVEMQQVLARAAS